MEEEKSIPTAGSVMVQGRVSPELKAAFEKALDDSGSRKFADFLSSVLAAWRKETAGKNEPTQVLAIETAVQTILKSTQSMVEAMRVIEADKYAAIEDYRGRVDEVADLLNEKETRIGELEGLLSTVQREFATAQGEAEKSKAEMQKEINRLKAVEETISDMRQSVKDARVNEEKALRATQTAQEALRKAEDDRTLMEREVAALKSKLEAIQAENERLLNTLEKYETASIGISNKLEAANEIKNQAIGQRDMLAKEVEQRRSEAAAANNEISKLQLEILNLKHELNLAKKPSV